ncbi:hypothetical protein SLS58_004567 [Diplodia intermedia]|uniref:Uncharacterized protein n=1 Tax=Diplodia intermedia TaxID=856260 RepID=A0ABR3TSY7_9PEZI
MAAAQVVRCWRRKEHCNFDSTSTSNNNMPPLPSAAAAAAMAAAATTITITTTTTTTITATATSEPSSPPHWDIPLLVSAAFSALMVVLAVFVPLADRWLQRRQIAADRQAAAADREAVAASRRAVSVLARGEAARAVSSGVSPEIYVGQAGPAARRVSARRTPPEEMV